MMLVRKVAHISRRLLRKYTTYAWGSCDNGQLGLPATLLEPDDHTFGQFARLPQAVPSLASQTVKRASISASHAAVVTSDGYLLVAGCGASGQLGLGDLNSYPEFELVSGLPPIVDVACGGEHTVVVTEKGGVLVAGSNRFGQVGTGAPIGRDPAGWTEVAELMDDGVKIQHVSAGDLFTVALSTDGGVYTWGATGPALGHGDSPEMHMSPAVRFIFGTGAQSQPHARRVRNLPAVRYVTAGKRHTVAIDERGRMFAWGDARHFVLGTTDEVARWTPVQSLGEVGNVSKVACGGTHTLVLTESGRVFGLGEGDHGCLGVGDRSVRSEATAVAGVSGVVDVAAGWHTSAAVDRTGRVWTWGSAMGGALGVHADADAYEPTEVGGLAARAVVMGSAGTSVLALG